MGFGYLYFKNLAAGSYTIKFKATWSSIDIKDYTVSVYAAEKVVIKDEKGKSNESTKDLL